MFLSYDKHQHISYINRKAYFQISNKNTRINKYFGFWKTSENFPGENFLIYPQNCLESLFWHFLVLFQQTYVWVHLTTTFTDFNPHNATGLFLYPLKTAENPSFSDAFRGVQKRPEVWNKLISKRKHQKLEDVPKKP